MINNNFKRINRNAFVRNINRPNLMNEKMLNC